MGDSLKSFYLQTMGIEQWVCRKEDKIQLLKKVKQQVKACQQCTLCSSRTNIVFADGNPNSPLMIIGEAPGYHEDQQGLPFVGKAGVLLNKMLESINLSRQSVYIANVLKCRPPSNRDPQPQEVVACSKYLKQQIEIVKPKAILALGRHAAHRLLNSSLSLAKLRLNSHQYQDIPMVVTFHPAYLLRNPRDKSKAYTDLLNMTAMLGENR